MQSCQACPDCGADRVLRSCFADDHRRSLLRVEFWQLNARTNVAPSKSFTLHNTGQSQCYHSNIRHQKARVEPHMIESMQFKRMRRFKQKKQNKAKNAVCEDGHTITSTRNPLDSTQLAQRHRLLRSKSRLRRCSIDMDRGDCAPGQWRRGDPFEQI